jgi:cytochrome c oxidase assembly protein subunit 11
MASVKQKNKRIFAGLVVVVAAMVGLSYAAVPLYDLFCRVTGFAGTTQVATEQPRTVGKRVFKIRFDATLNPSLPWEFVPEQREIALNVGKTALAYYRAHNVSQMTLTGTATFNVTPAKVGQYFNKIDCFCFTKQTLKAGETVDMPVTFFVDPAIVADRNLDDVDTITLSYTFYPAEGAAETGGEKSAQGNAFKASMAQKLEYKTNQGNVN